MTAETAAPLTAAETAEIAAAALQSQFLADDLAYELDHHARLIADKETPRRAYWLSRVNKNLRAVRAKIAARKAADEYHAAWVLTFDKRLAAIRAAAAGAEQPAA